MPWTGFDITTATEPDGDKYFFKNISAECRSSAISCVIMVRARLSFVFT
jgi:hypothetical protein